MTDSETQTDRLREIEEKERQRQKGAQPLSDREK